jgi:hypothetical protein
MSRSGYSDDAENVAMWRGAVARASRGKRGQAFLLEMWRAMQALPEPKLVANNLQTADGAVCAIGSVGKARGVDMSKLPTEEDDDEAHRHIAKAFNIPHALACEIMFMNDEDYSAPVNETSEARFARMKKWIEQNLLPVVDG